MGRLRGGGLSGYPRRGCHGPGPQEALPQEAVPIRGCTSPMAKPPLARHFHNPHPITPSRTCHTISSLQALVPAGPSACKTYIFLLFIGLIHSPTVTKSQLSCHFFHECWPGPPEPHRLLCSLPPRKTPAHRTLSVSRLCPHPTVTSLTLQGPMPGTGPGAQCGLSQCLSREMDGWMDESAYKLTGRDRRRRGPGIQCLLPEPRGPWPEPESFLQMARDPLMAPHPSVTGN